LYHRRTADQGQSGAFIRYLRGRFWVPLSSRLAQEGLIVDRETANLAARPWRREVALPSEQRATLQSWQSAAKIEQRLTFRARIILAGADGLSNKEETDRPSTRPATVSKWRGRFGR
jgi:hypothetical protein